MAPYEQYLERITEAVNILQAIAPTVDAVDDLTTEEDEAQFIQAFREVMRLVNMLKCFTQFSFDDLPMDEQLFADYRSKYLDLYEKVRNEHEKEKVSILDDLDFELELIRRDTINVRYIISLLQDMQNDTEEGRAKQHKTIISILDTEAQLRSKKELIEQFIATHFQGIPKGGDINDEFEIFWNTEKEKAVKELSKAEGLDFEGLQQVIGEYLFTEKPPMRDDVVKIMQKRPGLRERKTVSERIISKIKAFVETFIDGVD